jgi:purine-binding chemotaxis protein CheW
MAPDEDKHPAERRAALLQQAAAAVEAQDAREEPGIPLLLFALGGESYAFPLERVREVVKPGPITPVPSISEHILGVMNLRGEILPVLDPKRLLGIGAGTPGREGRIIVVKAPGMSVGFLADNVEDAIEVKGSIEPPLATLPERQVRYLRGQVIHEGLLVGVLSLDTLLEQRG